VPKFTQCLTTSPRLTREVLNHSRYGYQAASLSSLYRLARLCARGKSYDVLHAHFGPVGNSFRFARSLFGAPMVITFHGYDFSRWPQEKGADVYDELFQTVDVVISHSQYALGKLAELGCPSQKLQKLPVSSVDHSVFPFRERTLTTGATVRVLTVARLTEKKGIEYSIRAVAEVAKTHPRIRYDIVGEGPSRAELESLIAALGMQQTVFLHGARDSDYVQQMMSEAHLFMLASVTASDGDQEGTPVCLIEAQASGLPVLSTQHSGIPEIVVEGQTGFLVPERDVDALLGRLLHLVEHPGLWAELGRAGRKHVEEKYSLNNLNRQLVEIYDRAIKENSANGNKHFD
jgi:colanic acid/amylovoran biosynthesis glycosyltransferase